ncbi:MAG: hypothetical protein EBZ69_05085 [Alphaproteobacteria bacterium]|nr:hypothetical protein [Alphaproteobacteria bacterium]NDC56170.1 hypothetical protein [Alphaproteobacteria bacterium]NDG05187.1 hypothetical protein [Alphaproteobacteria bacterium]
MPHHAMLDRFGKVILQLLIFKLTHYRFLYLPRQNFRLSRNSAGMAEQGDARGLKTKRLLAERSEGSKALSLRKQGSVIGTRRAWRNR